MLLSWNKKRTSIPQIKNSELKKVLHLIFIMTPSYLIFLLPLAIVLKMKGKIFALDCKDKIINTGFPRNLVENLALLTGSSFRFGAKV